MWQHRPPGAIDIDQNVDLFEESSWQYVLYGMGYKTDLRPRAGTLGYSDEARAAFAAIRRQADLACRTLPTNRDLIATARARAFGAPGASASKIRLRDGSRRAQRAGWNSRHHGTDEQQ